MNHDDYATFEMAQALKSAGFDYPCYELWDFNFADDHSPVKVRRLKDAPRTTVMRCSNSELESYGIEAIAAPTLAIAQKWLREVKAIDVFVIPRYTNAYEVCAKRLGGRAIGTLYVFDLWDSTKPYKTYEAALAAGISLALDLIKNDN